jgi:hypothetical protein
MPRNSVIMITPRESSTLRAFRTSGGLKAWTPSATASIPVSATAPEAKARRTRNRLNGASASCGPLVTGAGAPAGGSPSRAYRTKPTTISETNPPMKRYDGSEKSLPDSRTPRRLPIAMSAIAATQSATREGKSTGKADVRAAMPAETLTATVSV